MSRLNTHRQLAEGKTKIIWQDPHHPHQVLIESKDDITAGDGIRRNLLPDKGAYANRTTCNCFDLLQRHGFSTHYVGPVDDRTFLARSVKMIPVELVVRRIATGSYLKRNPTIEEGTPFSSLVFERFAKDDALHDPLLTYDHQTGTLTFNDPTKPVGQGVIKQEQVVRPASYRQAIATQQLITQEVFLLLERAWAVQNVTLVDLKIECGLDRETGTLVVADVIDNDSWRIWPSGRKDKMLDKQVYRDLVEVTDEKMRDVLANYAAVANATDKFALV